MATMVREVLDQVGFLDVAVALNAPEARWLVDYFYAIQDFRIQADGQARAVSQGADAGTAILSEALGGGMKAIEERIAKALDNYSSEHVPGVWAKSITGIGPVLSAGLLAHLDIEQAPTVGHWWRFAGLDPSVRWLGSEKARAMVGESMGADKKVTRALVEALAQKTNLNADRLWDRSLPTKRVGDKWVVTGDTPTRESLIRALAKRPYNDSLKVLCWKIGDSFKKQKGRESDVYGRLYESRKAQEVERNEAGMFADQAATSLRERNIRDADLRKTYEAGKLPAGRLDLRAMRYTVKLFLSHFHAVSYEVRFGTAPPHPYVVEHLGHAHLIGVPHWKDGKVVA